MSVRLHCILFKTYLMVKIQTLHRLHRGARPPEPCLLPRRRARAGLLVAAGGARVDVERQVHVCVTVAHHLKKKKKYETGTLVIPEIGKFTLAKPNQVMV